MTEATVVIKGRNELSFAVNQAERQLKGLLRQGELVGKVLRGGAILGAALAFERLAENAEKAAEKIGDKGTAKALRQLNKEIDNLKSKGLNVIGSVLGGAYILKSGSDLDKLNLKIQNLTGSLKAMREEYERKGGDGFFGQNRRNAIFAAEAQLSDMQAQRAYLLKFNSGSGRAPGSRGGGRSAVLTEPTKPARTAAVDPMDGLAEVNVWQRQIFSLRNEQSAALAAFSEESRRAVSGDMQKITNETGKMLGTMSEQWKVATESWTVFSDQAARNIQDGFAQFLFDPFEEGINGMLKGFVDTLRQMLAQYVAFQAFAAAGSALAGSSNAFLSSIGTFLKGARASGGPVMGGGAYLVGEKGPEVFVPRSSGTVIPNGGMGGVTMNYSIDARGADAERIMAVLPAMLKRTKDETISAVLDLQRRGRFA